MQSASGSWCVLPVLATEARYLDTLSREVVSTFVSIKGNQEAGS